MSSGADPPPPTSVGLVVPIVIWGSKAPENKITTIQFLNDRTTLKTGIFYHLFMFLFE